MTALERAALERCSALEELLACYRFGTSPSERLHKRLVETKAALAALIAEGSP